MYYISIHPAWGVFFGGRPETNLICQIIYKNNLNIVMEKKIDKIDTDKSEKRLPFRASWRLKNKQKKQKRFPGLTSYVW